MIDYNLIPTYSINLSHLDEAIEITHIMKASHITKYSYAFEVNTATLIPTGPYLTPSININRPVAIRMTTEQSNRFVLLTICVGFGVRE